MITLQVRKFHNKWIITERNDDSTLMGPDRFGNHNGATFNTMADAIHAAQWRIDRLEDGQGKVERGPEWK